MDAVDQLAASLRERLVERARRDPSGQPVEEQVRALVEAEARPLPERERERLAEQVLRLATGLGPLEPLLADPEVDEVMVNGGGRVYVERDGRIEPADASFAGPSDLMHAIERILAPLGRRVDEASPLCDARLPDGSRVNVVIPPLAVDGPCLTIRRFRRGGFSLADLVANGTLPAPLADHLAAARRAPRDDPRERRHGLRQDHDARRAVRRDPGAGADRDDRGRGRAAAAPAARACGSRRGRRTSRGGAR